jgi:hypothetical protein
MGLTVLESVDRSSPAYRRQLQFEERAERLTPSRSALPISRELEAEAHRRDAERLASIDRVLADFDRAPARAMEEMFAYEDGLGGVLVSDDRLEHAFPRMPKRERTALLRRQAGMFRGQLLPILTGGVTGMQYASFKNAPEGTKGKDWDISPDEFYALTVRNEQLVPAPSKASGWDVASPLDFGLQRKGVLHEQFVDFVGTMTITPGTGSFTQGWRWPVGALGKYLSLQSAGESGVQYGAPTDFLARLQRLYRNPPMPGMSGGNATGTSLGLTINKTGTGIGVLQSGANAIAVRLPFPVSHDLRTGIGSIYRPSIDLSLNFHFEPPDMTQLIVLTGNATAVWSAVNVQLLETYMRVVKNDQGMIVLPDISRVFMTTVEEQTFTTNGAPAVSTAIPRLPGMLLCIGQVLDQGNGTTIDPTSEAQIRFVYGENQNPLKYLPERILEKNARDYDATLLGGKYLAFDGEVDNPQRDVWIPRNFTEGAIENDIPSSVTPAATSRSHLFFESLVQANIQ